MIRCNRSHHALDALPVMIQMTSVEGEEQTMSPNQTPTAPYLNGWRPRLLITLGSGTATGSAAFAAADLVLGGSGSQPAQSAFSTAAAVASAGQDPQPVLFGFSIAIAAAVATLTWAVVYPLLSKWYGRSTTNQPREDLVEK